MSYGCVRYLIILSSAVVVNSCNDVDFYIGPTPVSLEDGAREEIPCDFAEGIREIERFFEDNFDFHTAIKIMTKKLILYPSYDPPDPLHYCNGSCYYNGVTRSDGIHIRLQGKSIINTALVHEYAGHVACKVIYNDGNANHTNLQCKNMESDLTLFVKEKLKLISEKLCQ